MDIAKLKELSGIETEPKSPKKVNEGTIGGFAPVPVIVQHREMTDIDRWIAIVNEANLDEEEKSVNPQVLNEHVVGDLQNGYDRQHKTTAHDDYFPTGADSNVVDHAGPSSAKHGDNPMQKATKDNLKDEINESANIHSSLVYQYRDFIAR